MLRICEDRSRNKIFTTGEMYAISFHRKVSLLLFINDPRWTAIKWGDID